VRFAPPFARAKQLVDAGHLGAIAVADAWYLGNPIDYLDEPGASTSKAAWYTDAAQGGGLLAASAGPHLVDMLLWFGGPITEVAAQTISTRANGAGSAEDAFTVVGRFASGGAATLRGVPISYHATDTGVALHGTEGSLLIVPGGLRGATRDDGVLAAIAVPEAAGGAQAALATRFIAAIRDGSTAPTPNFDDGVAVQAVLSAGIEAARTRRWVAVTRQQ
jgi:predicted dehydrogenase